MVLGIKEELESMEIRQRQLHYWLKNACGLHGYSLASLAGDASFRRYYRLKLDGQSWVVMDAPLDKEDSHPYVAIQKILAEKGLRVPAIIHSDLEQGFLLLSDLGDRLYLDELNTDSVDKLYLSALDELVKIHSCKLSDHYPLAHFARDLLLVELDHFVFWFLQTHLQLKIKDTQSKMLQQLFKFLLDSAHTQTQVFVHRDYHSRNLMHLEQNQVGILDFQDAVIGPITYDAVSLLRDCYIDWPKDKVIGWALSFHKSLIKAGLLDDISTEQFMRWFDLMGLQRHLKAIFIFSRKFHRDHDSNYLPDISRALSYVEDVSTRYTELDQFHRFLKEIIFPKYNKEK